MQTPSNKRYPSQYENWITLKDGRKVFIRPILETDGPLIVDLFNKTSEHSRYLRMLSHIKALPEDLLFQFTHLDYDKAFALVAMIEEDEKDAIIAIARYAYDQQENYTELALVVRDDWQHYGLGKSLLLQLISIGKEHGISRFATVIDPQNDIILKIIPEISYDAKYSWHGGSLTAEIFV